MSDNLFDSPQKFKLALDGSLNNPADRDPCIQYMLAVALIRPLLERRRYHDV
jgi:2-methylcitrate dehydratase PrpD